ncbi:MAG: DUF4956 domain-containing protein [Clostridia bacterium]|nr:DUF4956 domain-containing protein [Clostridia bacterium]
MFGSIIGVEMTLQSFAICTAVSIVLGLLLAFCFMFRSRRQSPGLIVTFALLPLIVQVVISMVNGNIGVGVAVAGAFSLVRFRSAPGSAKDIMAVFSCMAVGLATGMGYVGVAVISAVLIGALYILYNLCRLGETRRAAKVLKITIPEGLDYNGVFDDAFEQYTTSHRLDRVKTSGMGSLYQLTYSVVLRDERLEKEFIDVIRCRNGNLEISCSRVESGDEEL